MPALAEFLKGTVEESLKKLLAPSGLIPASLFVLLNLAFVYPEARAHEIAVALEFKELADAWQAIAVAATILVLGYVMGSASSVVLDTLAGRTWNHSLCHLALRRSRKWRRGILKRRVGPPTLDAIEPLTEAEGRLHTRFAPSNVDPAPSALGDVLLATDGLARARFGMTLAAVWEPMRASLAGDNVAGKIAGEQKATVDLMAGLWLAFTAFVAEAILLFSLWDERQKVLLALLALPPAYIAYRVTVTNTLSWCDGVMNVLALHHEDLRKKLGLRDPDDAADRAVLWQKASRFLLWAPKVATDGLFEPEPVVKPKVRATANLKAETETHALREHDASQAAKDIHAAGTAFVLSVTAPDAEGDDTVSGDLHVSDPTIARIPVPPDVSSTNADVAVKVMSAPSVDVSDTLLLHLTDLRPGDAATLTFELTRWLLEVDKGLSLSVEEREGDTLRVTVANRTSADIAGATLRLLHVLDGRRSVRAEGHGQILSGGGIVSGRRQWVASKLKSGREFRFTIEFRQEEETS